ncbi:YbjN domain-containing protein [Eisenibacter elegans]|jgi:hypothetical protein|uniref:YbjN domain-containing protein n=1 Tax=Eisenibacter elegans TaxID=997 RepID=UPI000402FC0E|nr:YbjN domain-containing protein [Eisenibacter elegans]
MKSIKEIRIELVDAMIQNYVESVGMTKEETYDAERKIWHWQHGSATIEVFVHSVDIGNDKTREYLRIFSFLAPLPKVSDLQLNQFLIRLLEMNDVNLGVKLTVMQGTQKVYATYERDIRGMDYVELATCIADLEWWADKLDDELKLYYN